MELSPDKPASSFSALIAMMEHLTDPWGIKDPESRHLYMNRAAYSYTNSRRILILKVTWTASFPLPGPNAKMS